MKYLDSYNSYGASIKISLIGESDNSKVIDVLWSNFNRLVGSKQELLDKIKPRLNNGLSVYLSFRGDIIGVYLLNEKSINDFIKSIRDDLVSDFRRDDTIITLDEHLSDNGLQGIALSVLPKWRNMGYGRMLKEYTYGLGYDYIWGVQDKGLNNIEYWTRSRKVFAESSNRWATYIKLVK
jgi:GNAT superfamily N-acetyltransferase